MTFSQLRKALTALLPAFALSACQNYPPEPRPMSDAHLGNQPAVTTASGIPDPVRQAPYLPLPRPEAPVETYTVVVSEVPVKELLFALARDAGVNVDVSPSIEGNVTLNAVEQTLEQILDRIARQVNVRHEFRGDTLVIEPDTPYERNYRIDYVNMARDSAASMTVATQVAATGLTEGTGTNNSTTSVTSVSNHRLWETLVGTVQQMLFADLDARGELAGSGRSLDQAVIASPESGLLTVFASKRQHANIQAYLDEVMTSITRQVLIEATIVEVELSDEYQFGIDWASIASGAGISIAQSLILPGLPGIGAVGAIGTGFVVRATDGGGTTAVLAALKQFGETRVLSSPKLMALNNHTAVIKAVTNEVYYTIEATTSQGTGGSGNLQTFETTPNIVPVGVVMAITPQISASDEITLAVRPTITRVSRRIQDPNPGLVIVTPGILGTTTTTQIESTIPEITVREMESVLKLQSGQTAVLGGLMQDTVIREIDGVPVLSDIEVLGEAFKARDYEFRKSEVVVFLRPTVVRSPSLDGDLRNFEAELPRNQKLAKPLSVFEMADQQ